MSKVFVDVGISLDGFMAGPNPGIENPMGEGGLVIHEWLFNQQAFRRHLHQGEGGEKGTDNDLVEETISFLVCSPNRVFIASDSYRSFNGVEVPWALM